MFVIHVCMSTVYRHRQVKKVAPQTELTGLVPNTQPQYLNIVPEDVARLSCQNEGRGELGPTGTYVGGLST